MAYQNQSKSTGAACQPGDVLVVIHDFDARSADELTLRKGDRISLVELDDGFGDGWFLGKHLNRGNTGLFPGVYTQKLPGWSSAVRTSGPTVRASFPAEPEFFQPKLLNPYLSGSASLTPEPPGPAPELPQNPSSLKTWAKDNKETSQPSGNTSDSKHSSSLNRSSAVPLSSIPRNISQTIGQPKSGQDSPVMNETLSVIDEHITDLSTPRHSVVANDPRTTNDSASEYSNTLDSRSHLSYVAGPETEEEEDEVPSESVVKRWNVPETASYLRQIGIEPAHCEIFEEQEISGDVLLEMDQEFIHMKEYNFGVMGRRLKTWHKIRKLQDDAKGINRSRDHSVSHASAESGVAADLESRISTTTTGTTLPRISSLQEKPEPNIRQAHQPSPYRNVHKEHIPAPLQTQSAGSRSNTSAGAHISPWHALSQDSPTRPSAASVREMAHTRRHSSLDAGAMVNIRAQEKSRPLSSKLPSHKKQASFDRNWSMGGNTPTSHGHPDNSTLSNDLSPKKTLAGLSPSQTDGPPSADLDRGYFSGPEGEASKSRRFLRKHDGSASANHSRHSSFVDQQKRDVATRKRHSRFGSADSIREVVPAVTSAAAQAYHSKSFKGRFRSASTRKPTPPSPGNALSPTVTNLEDGHSPSLPTPSPRAESDVSGTSSPLPPLAGKSSMKQRRFGLRTISDTVTNSEKALASSPTSIPSSLKDTPLNSPSRTGSSTPSATSRSIDMDKADAFLKSPNSAGPGGPPKIPVRGKTKKETSAYAKGLEKRSPAEQRMVCDYSGWMKKKSSSLMTTWKPRLFFLRGRRLSYYYSENDTTERGVIDISSHKVLRADQDTITNLHATITGSASTPIVQSPPADGNAGASSTGRGKTPATGAPFFFKLIPPKAGLSRAVQFTKPTIHYFQVDSLHEGRKWMAALMKATIEFDPTFGLETTNKQKTISLAKARSRKERPPALKGDEPTEPVSESPTAEKPGLNIRGLSYDETSKDETQPNGISGSHKKFGSAGAAPSAWRTRAASETLPS